MPNHSTPFPDVTLPWAKLQPKRERPITAWQSLEAHSADVAACLEALLLHTAIGGRLARLGGLDALPEAWRQRLCVMAALHDMGKCQTGFQLQLHGKRAAVRGHVLPGVWAVCDTFSQGSLQLLGPLGTKHLQSWGGDTGAAFELLIAAICHHGRPYSTKAVTGAGLDKGWQPSGDLPGYAPNEALSALIDRARAWFPDADDDTAPPLPNTAAFQHAYSGAVMLADWLGSDEQFFALCNGVDEDAIGRARQHAVEAVAKVGLDPASAHAALRATPPSMARVLGADMDSARVPYDTQTTVFDLPVGTKGSLTLLEAETGSGKTEAAVGRYAQLLHAGVVDGMYFALPTRTAAGQIHRRVVEMIARLFPDEATRPHTTLAVPGYIAPDAEGASLCQPAKLNDERADGTPVDERDARLWAGERPKRYLAGAVAVGTIDQALLSTLAIKHAHLRATSLLRHLLVVDEVHASDPYMRELLSSVLAFHLQAGGHALLMSATLGSDTAMRLLAGGGVRTGRRNAPRTSKSEATALAYPMIRHLDVESLQTVEHAVEGARRTKAVRVQIEPIADDPAAVAALGLRMARDGARVLIIRNLVADCVATQRALEDAADAEGAQPLLFSAAGVIAPHHSRFARRDRLELDRAIESTYGRDRADSGPGVVAVATQTVEQSLDLDADFLISDVCPMDVLLQRIGRLHRHDRPRPLGFADAAVAVCRPAERDLKPFLALPRPRLSHGIGTVYMDVRVIEATLRELEHFMAERGGVLTIPADNRRLVEAATHHEALAAITAEGEAWERHGFAVTGQRLVDRMTAQGGLLDRTQHFGDATFPDDERGRRIGSRLGEANRTVLFDPPRPGPFGAAVDELILPHWLAAGVPIEALPEGVTEFAGGFRFQLASRAYRYDRHGLASEEANPTGEKHIEPVVAVGDVPDDEEAG